MPISQIPIPQVTVSQVPIPEISVPKVPIPQVSVPEVPVERIAEPRGRDIDIARAIQAIQIPGLTSLMRFATNVGGDFGVLLMTIAIAGWLTSRGMRRDAVFVLLTLLVRLPNILIKRLFGRPRP